jgi:hypothetical protein
MANGSPLVSDRSSWNTQTAHRVRHCAASGDAIRATPRLEQAASLTARFARHSFLRGLRPAGRALAAPLSGPPRGLPSLPRSLSGRFGAGALRPFFGGVTAFSRYAERVDFALSVSRHYGCMLLSSSALGAHRFGKPLMMHGLRKTSIVGCAGVSLSALLLLHSGGGNEGPNRRPNAPSCSP